MNKLISTFLLITITWVFFTSCNQLDVFERNSPIPKTQWAYGHKPVFDFNISDTSSRYLIFVVLRHTDAYRYNNIWINVGLQTPGDTMRYKRIEVQLGNDAKGWEGSGMDDIWEIMKPISAGPVKFRKSGTCRFTLEQVMRENPLIGIMSAGIRIEKVK